MGFLVRRKVWSNGDGRHRPKSPGARSPEPRTSGICGGSHAGRLFGTRTGSGTQRSGVLAVEYRLERSSEFPVRKLWRTRANTVSLIFAGSQQLDLLDTSGSVQRSEEAEREEVAGPGGASTPDSCRLPAAERRPSGARRAAGDRMSRPGPWRRTRGGSGDGGPFKDPGSAL